MKLFSLIVLMLVAPAMYASEADLTSYEGEFKRLVGEYYLENSNGSMKLRGVDFSTDSISDGSKVSIAGKLKDGSLEVYTFDMITDKGNQRVYDWNEIDEELYSN